MGQVLHESRGDRGAIEEERMKRVLLLGGLLAAVWISIGAGPAWAQGEATGEPAIGPNVRVTLTIVDSEPGSRPAESTYEYVARGDGASRATLIMGWRVPIPRTRAMEDEEDVPLTEYVYQNIGFTAQLFVTVLEDDRILVRGQIEASGARKGPEEMREAAEEDHLPIIGTFQQDLNVTLKAGRPLRLSEVPDPEGGRVYLEIKAEPID
jgi:hypothetical protein